MTQQVCCPGGCLSVMKNTTDRFFLLNAACVPRRSQEGSASTTAFFVLEHGQVHFCQGLQGCFWVRKLLEKTVVPPWRGLRSAHAAFLSCQATLFFLIKQFFFCWAPLACHVGRG